MRAGGIEWDWWHPLERFLPEERRRFSLLVIVSMALHVAGLAIFRTGRSDRVPVTAGAPEVVLLARGEGAESRGGKAMWFDLSYEDPSAIAVPRVASLFSHSALPAVAAPMPGPARPESLTVSREFLPSKAMPPEELAASLLGRRPLLAPAAVPRAEPPPTQGLVSFGSAIARRLASPPPQLDPVVRDQPLDGPTVLSIAVDAEGGVRDAIIAGSCGAAELDARAVELAWRIRFLPAAERGTVWASAAFHWPQTPDRAGREPAP